MNNVSSVVRFPAVILMITVLLAVAVSGYLLLGFDGSAVKPRTALKPLDRIQVPSYNPADLEKFQRYLSGLEYAIESKSDGFAPSALKIFGYAENGAMQNLTRYDKPYHLSMIYESGGHRYALIDNKLYKTGNYLPGGALVREINISGVIIEKDGVASISTVESFAAKPIEETQVSREGSSDTSSAVTDSQQSTADAANRARRQLEQMQDVLELVQPTSTSQ